MKLEMEDGSIIEDPTPDQISAAVRSLSGDGNNFATLAKDLNNFIQTSGSQETGYVLEHHTGPPDSHYVVAGGAADVSRVIRAFQDYAVNNANWHVYFNWEQFGQVPESRETPVKRTWQEAAVGGCMTYVYALQLASVVGLFLLLVLAHDFDRRPIVFVPLYIIAGPLIDIGLSEAVSMAIALAVVWIVLDAYHIISTHVGKR